MSTSTTLAPPEDFVDPRQLPGFAPSHWPLCNGAEIPVRPADLHERRCLEFLALFYRLNQLNSELLAARAAEAPEDVIRQLLEQVGAATARVEQAEDRYAPVGFFPEPLMDGIRYADIKFVRPELPRIYSQPHSQCAHIRIPGLEDIPAEELRGPMRILHFGHGKVDL